MTAAFAAITAFGPAVTAVVLVWQLVLQLITKRRDAKALEQSEQSVREELRTLLDDQSIETVLCIAQRAKMFCWEILFRVGEVHNEAWRDLFPLRIPGADRFLGLQKDMKRIARGDDWKIVRFLESIQVYEEALTRCEMAARGGHHATLVLAVDTLFRAAVMLERRCPESLLTNDRLPMLQLSCRRPERNSGAVLLPRPVFHAAAPISSYAYAV